MLLHYRAFLKMGANKRNSLGLVQGHAICLLADHFLLRLFHKHASFNFIPFRSVLTSVHKHFHIHTYNVESNLSNMYSLTLANVLKFKYYSYIFFLFHFYCVHQLLSFKTVLEKRSLNFVN